jgi:hypothetical protein
MTTIAFRDGVLAGDGRVTTGDMVENAHASAAFNGTLVINVVAL